MLICFLVFICFSPIVVTSNAIELNEGNINDILNQNELVFVNFYADWCRFSQMLRPIFDDAATKIAEHFPEPGKVAFAKVDCDRENGIAQRYSISKYPTLKLFRSGQVTKKEYRGQRSADAFKNFISQQLETVLNEHANIEELDQLDGNKRHIISYLESKESQNFQILKDLSSKLREECQFHVVLGEAAESHRTGGDSVTFRDVEATSDADLVYTGIIQDQVTLQQWATDKCVPLVREITFQNAEELTEEGLPFLILFHHPEDHETVKLFTEQVQSQLLEEKVRTNFLTGDGLKFSHPLHHLGKSPQDLPVLAIDSFKHMYLFPSEPLKDHLGTPGLLKQFVQDLHSGKLHREFHHGPDVTTQAPEPVTTDDGSHVPKAEGDEAAPSTPPPPSQDPPESVFNKLKPSKNRYTVLRDEL